MLCGLMKRQCRSRGKLAFGKEWLLHPPLHLNWRCHPGSGRSLQADGRRQVDVLQPVLCQLMLIGSLSPHPERRTLVPFDILSGFSPPSDSEMSLLPGPALRSWRTFRDPRSAETDPQASILSSFLADAPASAFFPFLPLLHFLRN